MSESKRKGTQPEIDISTSGSAPKLGWKGNLLIWATVFPITVAMLVFEVPFWLIVLLLVGTVIALFLGWFVWAAVIKRGVFTWLRLARKPAKLMAQGDDAGAEIAYHQALARARRFGAEDGRRGVMLCELAMFAKCQGRYPEALALFEESIEILIRHMGQNPLDYFVALNNYAIYYIHIKDYHAALGMLERAIDLTYMVKKRDGVELRILQLPQMQGFQFVVHLNLAFLLMEMNELADADRQLAAADSLLPLLPKGTRRAFEDHYAAICAMWEFESGRFAEAECEIAEAPNRDYIACLRVRGNLHLIRQEYDQAEELFRRHQAEERKKGPLHRPEMLKPTLELAEALLGQSKVDEAFAAVAEACSLVADFQLPMDTYWQRTARTWHGKTLAHARHDLAETLAKELLRVPPPAVQTIKVLEKFRAKPVALT